MFASRYNSYPSRRYYTSSPFFPSRIWEDDNNEDEFFSTNLRRNNYPVSNMDSLLAQFLKDPYFQSSSRQTIEKEEEESQEEGKPIRIPIQFIDSNSAGRKKTEEISFPENKKEVISEKSLKNRIQYESDESNCSTEDDESKVPVEIEENDITPEEWSQIQDLELAEEKEKEKRRMLERFIAYGVKERPVPGDGNCQFASISDQLFDTPNYHKNVREMIVDWLYKNPNYCLGRGTYLKDFLQTDRFPTWEDYCKYLSKEGSWGDHITLLAASEVFQCKIIILSSIEIKDPKIDPIIIITPKKNSTYSNLFMSLV